MNIGGCLETLASDVQDEYLQAVAQCGQTQCPTQPSQTGGVVTYHGNVA